MLGLLWYLQRRLSRGAARKRDGAPITVLGRQNLGAKAQLVIVQTSDARYVLGVTENGVSVVDRLAVEEPAADETPASDSDADSTSVTFESIMAGASSSTDRVPEQRLRVRHRSDPLRGSIISPETWRQTAEALRRSR